MKELKPISGRVKEIAEFVFASVMERVVSHAIGNVEGLESAIGHVSSFAGKGN